MPSPPPNWSAHQLTEFLAALYGRGDEASASLLAIERVAEALDAEIGALVRGDEVVCSVGFPHGQAPVAELVELAAGDKAIWAVEGLGQCRVLSVPVGDEAGVAVVIARVGRESFSAEEISLAQGLARVLAMTLRVIRVAQEERIQREAAQSEADLNQRLIQVLEERQALLSGLSRLQRSIAHGAGRERLFESIVAGACELLGDYAATLVLVDPDDPRWLEVVAASIQRAFAVGDRVPLIASIPGRAIAEESLLVDEDYQATAPPRAARCEALGHDGAAASLRAMVDEGVSAVIAAPVHEHGRVVGSLVVCSRHRGRRFTTAERDIMVAFAEHASLALTDTLRIEDRRAQAARRVEQRYEARLHQLQRLDSVGQLAGGIAHDFNNLLSVIINYARFVIDALDPGSPERSDAQEIAKAAERASQLTKQLLLFSRRAVVRTRVVDAASVLAGIESLLRRTLGEAIEFRAEIAQELPTVEADPTQLEQVLVNLTVNARDAMPNGGTFTIELAAVELDAAAAGYPDLDPGRYVRLAVSDTGDGMSAEVVERAFEPFFTTKPPGQGTGLGLATVYGIVKQAHGAIAIDSTLGGGTTVTIELPTASKPPAPADATPEELARANGTATILLVEDEEPVRELALRILESSGYSVLTAGGAEDALETWREHASEIDVLLTDVVMPKVSGPELAEELGRQRPDLRRIFMSGYADEVPVAKRLSGDVHLLEKPFAAEELLDVVGRSLDEEAQSGDAPLR